MQYSIHGVGAERVLMVASNVSHRFKFLENNQAVKFRRSGGKLVAAVHNKIAVYKKPHSNTFHFEYMQANRSSLSRGEGGANSERILDNMLEYIETI